VAILSQRGSDVTDDKHLRVPGDLQRLFDWHTPRAVHASRERGRQRSTHYARRMDDGGRLDPLTIAQDNSASIRQRDARPDTNPLRSV
jgi:hypothetical protein